jgi:hypothetical protein
MEIERSHRAADADREQVAERLRHATAEGRLNTEELEERLHALYGARTYGELDALLADLPASRSPGRQRVPVARWAAAVGACMLMLAALGALVARVRSSAAIVATGAGAVRHPRFPGPLGQPKLLPPVPDPTQGLIVAGSVVGAFLVVLVCGIVLWVSMQSRGRSAA